MSESPPIFAKTLDQLYGMVRIVEVRPAGASKSKRKSDEEHQPRATRKQMRHGISSEPLEAVAEPDYGDGAENMDRLAKKAGLVSDGEESELTEVEDD